MIRDIHDLIPFLKRYHRRHAALMKPPPEFPVGLPDGLRLLYENFGALIELDIGMNEHPFGAQDALFAASNLKFIDGMVEFAMENQCNWTCRCKMGPGDPPLVTNAADVWHDTKSGFQEMNHTLNHFLVTFCLQEALFSSPVLVSTRDHKLSREQVFATPLEPLWLDGCYTDNKPSHHFCTIGPDVIVMDYAGLWLGALDKSALSLFRPGVEVSSLR